MSGGRRGLKFLKKTSPLEVPCLGWNDRMHANCAERSEASPVPIAFGKADERAERAKIGIERRAVRRKQTFSGTSIGAFSSSDYKKAEQKSMYLRI